MLRSASRKVPGTWNKEYSFLEMCHHSIRQYQAQSTSWGELHDCCSCFFIVSLVGMQVEYLSISMIVILPSLLFCIFFGCL